jgi:hypothetical protein
VDHHGTETNIIAVIAAHARYVMRGDDDQIPPYADSARLSAKLLRNSTLKTYKEFPRGLLTIEADTINADVRTFLKGASTPAAA